MSHNYYKYLMHHLHRVLKVRILYDSMNRQPTVISTVLKLTQGETDITRSICCKLHDNGINIYMF